MNVSEKIEQLLAKGVRMAAPSSIEVGDDVDVGRIADSVVIHAGCKLFGAKTSIGPDSVLGREAPATIENCQLGRNVQLKGGYFSGAVFLDGAAMGSCAHVRAGTILEEGAEMAHSVGLKQSIFFPFVVGGSLLNVCDLLMAGGLSRTVHSEIGSSFIHFNFTPHGDKATASLIGDVPRGVMLDQKPIFLGGQGGVVGPVRVEYGTVMGAGNILRKDVLSPSMLIAPECPPAGISEYQSAAYHSVDRKLNNCLTYIGNIVALQVWYERVRRPFMTSNSFHQWCVEGALEQLAAIRKERIKRMDAVIQMLAAEPADHLAGLPAPLQEQHQKWVTRWPAKKDVLAAAADVDCPESGLFLAAWNAAPESAYIDRIRGLSVEAKQNATIWLNRIVEAVLND